MRIPCILFAIAACSAGVVHAQNNVLIDDDANRSDNASLGTTNNGLTWTEGGISASPSITSNQIQFDANSSNGADYATVDLSTLSPAWNDVLTNNTGIIEWRFNMRVISNKLNGFSNGGNGAAYVLAANSPNLTTGEGYAVVLGNPGAAKPIRLVHYTGGLDDNANLTNIMFAGDFPDGEFLAVYVQYNPVNDKWGMQYAVSTASFPDPLTAIYTQIANITDATYVNDPGFQYAGILHNHLPGAVNQAFFDNISSLQQWVLPITLSYFEASAVNDDVELHWVTES